jgi:hypothetical protein
MFVCCEWCVLSGRGLFDELITRPEESYRLWCVVVRDLDNLKNEDAMTRVGSQRHSKQTKSVIWWKKILKCVKNFCYFWSCISPGVKSPGQESYYSYPSTVENMHAWSSLPLFLRA